jgi:PhnB protein
MKKPAKKNKVDPIPKGYSVLTTHLSIKGASQAIDFYAKAFGAKTRMRMDGPGGTIGHAELLIGTSVFMLADEFPGSGALSPATLNGTTASFYLYVKDVDAAYARALAAGATQLMPPMDMFYGDRIGSLKDPFGHVWSLATHIEDVSPKEMTKRAKEWADKMAAGKPPSA